MMKQFFLIMFLAFSAFAQNLTIEEIFIRYEKNLMNIQQGMTSKVDITSTEYELDNNGDMVLVDVNYKDTEIILRKKGNLVHSYRKSINLNSGEVLKEVALVDYSYNANDYLSIKNYSLINDVLNASIEAVETYGDETYITKGTIIKDLMSPIFCNSSSDTIGEWVMSDGTSEVFTYREKSKCVSNQTLNELKQLKQELKEIEFCDYTSDDDDLFCETEDMTFLLNNI